MPYAMPALNAAPITAHPELKNNIAPMTTTQHNRLTIIPP